MRFHKQLMNNNCEKHKILVLSFNCNDHMETRFALESAVAVHPR